jgi:hypothetical protein
MNGRSILATHEKIFVRRLLRARSHIALPIGEVQLSYASDDHYEAGEKMVKGHLLGTVAGLIGSAAAQAADMPVEAKPVQYVKSAAFTATASTTFQAPTPASSWAGICVSRPNTMPAPAEPRSARARPRRREAHSLRIAHIPDGFGSADVALDPLLAAKAEAEEPVGVWIFRPMP